MFYIIHINTNPPKLSIDKSLLFLCVIFTANNLLHNKTLVVALSTRKHHIKVYIP